ncbi:MAG: glycosyltransferase family 39 protein [Pyrinomonadaceae bacterium]
MGNGIPPRGGATNEDHPDEKRTIAAVFQDSWMVLVHLALTIPLSIILNIRLDEGYTLNTTGAGLRYAWTQALRFELQPPLFFALLSLWRRIDSSILFARFFSVICATLTVLLAIALARRYVPRVQPWIVGVIVAIHPFMIWVAVDIRVYAFALLLASLLLVLFFDGYLSDEAPGWKRWAYLVVALLALYTQYYLGFLLLANALALVFQRRWRPLRSYLWGMLAVGILFLPMLGPLYRQFFVHSKDITQHDEVWTSLNDFLWIVKGYLIPAESTKFESVRRWIQMLGLPLLAVFVLLNRKRISWRDSGPIWVITLTMLPIFFFLRYRIGYDYFSPRHAAVLFFPSILSFVALVYIAGRKWGMWVLLVLAITASAVSLVAVYRPWAKRGDWRRAAEYVSSKEQPGEPILFFSPTGALPFGYYYRGPNQLVPIPRPETFDTYDVERYVIHSETELIAQFGSIPGSPVYVWVVTDHFCRLQPVEFNCSLLELFLSRYYVTESDREFYGSRVRRLRRIGAGAPAPLPK